MDLLMLISWIFLLSISARATYQLAYGKKVDGISYFGVAAGFIVSVITALA